MIRQIEVLLLSLILLLQSNTAPPASQPATRPADSQPAEEQTLRKPAQADILKNLLRERDQPRPIIPERNDGTPVTRPTGPDSAAGELVDGTFLSMKSGRLVREGGKSMFSFILDPGARSPVSFELLENEFLELMENEAEAGRNEFTISAEVTRYRGHNYLLVKNLQRRLTNGNLSP